MPAETIEQRKAYIAGLVKERESPAADRKAIDAELKRVREATKTPAKRAQTRER